MHDSLIHLNYRFCLAAIAFNFDFNFSWWCSHDFELLIHFCLHFCVLRDCFLPVLLLILFAFKFLFN